MTFLLIAALVALLGVTWGAHHIWGKRHAVLKALSDGQEHTGPELRRAGFGADVYVVLTLLEEDGLVQSRPLEERGPYGVVRRAYRRVK